MEIDDVNEATTTNQDAKKNKIVLHGAEYEKLKTAVIHTVKLFEGQGN